MRLKAGAREKPFAAAAGRHSTLLEFPRPGSENEHSLLEYQGIFENAIVGICSMRNRIMLRCNQRFEEIFGYGSGELNNVSVRVLYPTQEAFDRIGRVYPSFSKHNQYVHEPQLVRKDGTLIWCTVSGRVLDPREPARGSVWVVQDITERKRAENSLRRLNKRLELRVEQRTTNLRRINQTLKVEVQRRKEIQHALVESREKYRALFRTFPIGIAITDDEGNIVEVNRALHRLTGQKKVAGIQQIGLAPLDLIRADGSQVERDHLARVRALRENRRVEDGEIGVRRPDGSYVWLSTTAAPIPVNGYGVVAAYTDVTERKEAIERDKRQQSEFARCTAQRYGRNGIRVGARTRAAAQFLRKLSGRGNLAAPVWQHGAGRIGRGAGLGKAPGRSSRRSSNVSRIMFAATAQSGARLTSTKSSAM